MRGPHRRASAGGAHDPRALLRAAAAQREPAPSAAVLDGRALRSTPEGSGPQAGWDGGHKRKRGSKVHMAMDTLGRPPALHVAAATADDRGEVVQAATGEGADLAYVDQGCTGARAEEAAAARGGRLGVVKLPEAKRGSVLPPRRRSDGFGGAPARRRARGQSGCAVAGGGWGRDGRGADIRARTR